MDARSFSAEEVCAIKNEWQSETYSSNSGHLFGHVTGTVFILGVPEITATIPQISWPLYRRFYTFCIVCNHSKSISPASRHWGFILCIVSFSTPQITPTYRQFSHPMLKVLISSMETWCADVLAPFFSLPPALSVPFCLTPSYSLEFSVVIPLHDF